MAEKTEKATPKKLRDARKKGQVAKAQDLPSAFTFITSVALTLTGTKFLFDNLASFLVGSFNSIVSPSPAPLLAQSLLVILQTSLPIAIGTALVGVLISFLVVGPVFSSEVLKPDLKRLNPVTNLKNMFKMKTVIELLKSIVKITVAVALVYTVIRDSLPEIIATAGIPPLAAADVFATFLLKVIIRVGVFFLIIAVFDLVFQRYNFSKEMRMEKFEVKQEFRDTEGDPHLKSRRKQTAQEIAYQEGPMSARRARAIITNPIHIAVAITYQEEEESAPKIVTMGKGLIADQIVRYALEAGVPIMRNVPLAHTLFEKGQIGNYIPQETYEMVAELLHMLKRFQEGEGETLLPQ